MVRAARIELALQAWEAHVLPIYYARLKERKEGQQVGIGKPEIRDDGEQERFTAQQDDGFARIPDF